MSDGSLGQEDNGGRMIRVVIDLLLGDAEFHRGRVGFPSAGVACEAGEGAAADLDSDPVAFLEPVSRRPEGDAAAREPVGVGEADQPVADVERAAARVDVAQPHEDVGVGQAGAEPDLRADLADDLDIVPQGGGGVGEYVAASFQGLVVDASGGGGQPGSADSGGWGRRGRNGTDRVVSCREPEQ